MATGQYTILGPWEPLHGPRAGSPCPRACLVGRCVMGDAGAAPGGSRTGRAQRKGAVLAVGSFGGPPGPTGSARAARSTCCPIASSITPFCALAWFLALALAIAAN